MATLNLKTVFESEEQNKIYQRKNLPPPMKIKRYPWIFVFFDIFYKSCTVDLTWFLLLLLWLLITFFSKCVLLNKPCWYLNTIFESEPLNPKNQGINLSPTIQNSNERCKALLFFLWWLIIFFYNISKLDADIASVVGIITHIHDYVIGYSFIIKFIRV